MDKKIARQRRANKTRAKIYELEVHRLCIHRTPQHIYAQLIEPEGGRTLASVSTVQSDVRGDLKNTGNAEAARKVGTAIAAKAKELGVETVAFDRSGFRYHGRVQALADAAREGGLQF